jgi:Ni,Fe-hydrogenase III small subunit/Pyruvate/2-oxoacid:ferredoxin oxidoreductase delta subunit
MLKLLKERIAQGHQTSRYPKVLLELPERFRGRPRLTADACAASCDDCAAHCPTEAIKLHPLTLDLGACTFCGLCEGYCEAHAITFTSGVRLSARSKQDLLLTAGQELKLASALSKEMLRLFGRSLKLRQVSAGGCNGCESDLNVLSTVGFDLGRFGIQFVASPRHADGIVVTGPVTKNMEFALRETYAAIPTPKIVIAVGACAISGGAFAGSGNVLNGVPAEIPVDLYLPGCPPHPYTTLDGLLTLLGRLPAERASQRSDRAQE